MPFATLGSPRGLLIGTIAPILFLLVRPWPYPLGSAGQKAAPLVPVHRHWPGCRRPTTSPTDLPLPAACSREARLSPVISMHRTSMTRGAQRGPDNAVWKAAMLQIEARWINGTDSVSSVAICVCAGAEKVRGIFEKGRIGSIPFSGKNREPIV